jgi:hypothetical protein
LLNQHVPNNNGKFSTVAEMDETLPFLKGILLKENGVRAFKLPIAF